jgi:flagellar biosynthetic protein FliQ
MAPHRAFADHEFLVTEQFAIDVSKNAFMIALQIGGPLLMGSLLVGMSVSVFQAVTQINESSLSFVPKVLVVAGLLALLGPWMANTLIGYMIGTFNLLPTLTR